RQRGATLERFAADLARAGRLAPEVARAFAAYQEVRFGGRTFDLDRERILQLAIATAQAMRPVPAETAPAVG
ncbi:MAG: DUF4129 domain-containing protein, partial [Planctomycetota bacterium]